MKGVVQMTYAYNLAGRHLFTPSTDNSWILTGTKGDVWPVEDPSTVSHDLVEHINYDFTVLGECIAVSQWIMCKAHYVFQKHNPVVRYIELIKLYYKELEDSNTSNTKIPELPECKDIGELISLLVLLETEADNYKIHIEPDELRLILYSSVKAINFRSDMGMTPCDLYNLMSDIEDTYSCITASLDKPESFVIEIARDPGTKRFSVEARVIQNIQKL